MLSDLAGILAKFRHLMAGGWELVGARFRRESRQAVITVRGYVLDDGVDF